TRSYGDWSSDVCSSDLMTHGSKACPSVSDRQNGFLKGTRPSASEVSKFRSPNGSPRSMVAVLGLHFQTVEQSRWAGSTTDRSSSDSILGSRWVPAYLDWQGPPTIRATCPRGSTRH